ncbi:WXG100 family type VII secretion target [Corynebacterium felinum]|uniref:ESAT-6-like protein n=1 Tax=Corynebacterium felinum TaxID=131318 RepID=A0ABU2B6Y3_9CORY|nr:MULTISPECIES: WXG100 family type VII secretion target [Corynebacterium]MDF5819759.1 WXG100 family type VII secretion target [Corynebacterium felinum]MDO4762463.1 WXG100 family type VII secretion target [Corynebacterium sp.]MDR7354375.1 early secretory antigenic target protein ESAT-6 [Corynebacterium felinum]WJY93746.1 6 kDa early secretory antigenic target [Corynebacterium felinum]
MSIYAYDNSRAETAAQDLNSVMNQIESTLMEMDGDIQKLAASWDGSEQETYQGVHGKWSKAANNIKTILGQVRASLEENTQGVAETRGRVNSSLFGE